VISSSAPPLARRKSREMRAEPLLLTAAAEATRLLQRYGITRPAEIALEDIAWALGVEVATGSLSGAEAHLVRVGDVGTIMLSDRLVNPGDRRFAIAHELGHWRMHGADSQVFFCTDSDMKEYRNSGQELEANTFASELLMPKSMIDPKLLRAEPSWSTVHGLSQQFSVAPITAAIRYAELASQPVIAVFSDGRTVHWWRENRARMDGLWLESRQSISDESAVFHEVDNPSGDYTLHQVPWRAWFPHIDAREEEELWEFSAPLDDKGTWLSMLWVPSRC